MVTSNDDLCNARHFMVIACIPVFGRMPLLKHTIERLYKKNGVYKVICVGDGPEKELCESLGAVWVHHVNKPLGRKWNAAFVKAQDYYHDACLFVGSSDWLSDNWLSEMEPHMKDNDLIGSAGCNFMHLYKDGRIEACYWRGYTERRKGESIGIGRLISKKILKEINYRPFDDKLDNSLDYSMIRRISDAQGRIKVVETKAISVSISTDLWRNKHQFSHHYTGLLPSKRIENAENWANIHFPEAKTLFI